MPRKMLYVDTLHKKTEFEALMPLWSSQESDAEREARFSKCDFLRYLLSEANPAQLTEKQLYCLNQKIIGETYQQMGDHFGVSRQAIVGHIKRGLCKLSLYVKDNNIDIGNIIKGD